jgi:hypothetical protein
VFGPWLLDLLEYRRAQFAQPGDLGVPALGPGVQVQVQPVLDRLGLWNLLEEKPSAQPCAGDLLNRVVGMPDGLQSAERGPPGHRRDHAAVDVPGGQQLLDEDAVVLDRVAEGSGPECGLGVRVGAVDDDLPSKGHDPIVARTPVTMRQVDIGPLDSQR